MRGQAVYAVLLGLLAGCAGPPPPIGATSACPISAVRLTPAPPGATDAEGLFPTSYADGRQRFRKACAGAVNAYRGFCHAIPIVNRAQQDLTVDLAYISANNGNLLILQSGLHGAEGFAGSAVQARALERHIPDLVEQGFDVVMIHAINPYGFANVRRVDECNVDLNRNFPNSTDMYRSGRNLAYETLRALTERPEPVGNVVGEKAAIKLETVLAALRYGPQAVAEGTHRGQYIDPTGFEYGGWSPAQQTTILRNEIQPLIQNHPGDVYFLDLHTGLGPINALTLISGADWPRARVERLSELAGRTAVQWKASGDASASGSIRAEGPCDSRFSTSGDVIDFVPMLANDDRVTAITAEWGTIGNSTFAELETNARQTLEHQAYFHGCDREEVCAQVRTDFAQLFNPSDAQFRRAVLTQADALLDVLPRITPGSFRGFRSIPFTVACRR